jgi:DNA replication protein DnaC
MSRCPRCDDAGYVTRPGERWAEARVCRHLASCPQCHGRGLTIANDAAGHALAAPCACPIFSVAKRVDLFNRAKIPARFASSRIDTYVYRDHGGTQFRVKGVFSELCETFAPGARGVGLSGDPGVGKTHLLTALCGFFALELGLEVRYTDFADLIGELRAGFERGGGAETLVGTVVDAPVLFVDELGKGRATEWEQSIVDAIISRRYSRGLTLFFATNYGLDDRLDALDREPLQVRIGPRAASRLREMCRFEAIIGPDGRELQAQTMERPGAQAAVKARPTSAPEPPKRAPAGMQRVR